MDKTSKTTLIMMINKTSMIVLTMMISAMMIRGARIWEHLRGGGRLHYLAGSARAERRGQPGCSTPAHLCDDDDDLGDLGDDNDDVMVAVFIIIFIIIMTIVS